MITDGLTPNSEQPQGAQAQPDLATTPAPSAEILAQMPLAPRTAFLEARMQDPQVAWLDRVAAMADWLQERGVTLPPGSPVTSDEFAIQAASLGLKLEPIQAISRFAVRPPDVIAVEGFQPNPKEKPGTLLEHLERRSCGFVSCTDIGTEHVAEALALGRGSCPRVGEDRVGQALALAAELKEPWLAACKAVMETKLSKDSSAEQIASVLAAMKTIEATKTAFKEGLGIQMLTPFEQTYRMFEYKIEGVEGVRVADLPEFPYYRQKETTILAAAPENITAVREVQISLNWVLTADLELVTAQGGDDSASGTICNGTKVSFGDWQSMVQK